jgi:hypothetical protein
MQARTPHPSIRAGWAKKSYLVGRRSALITGQAIRRGSFYSVAQARVNSERTSRTR